MIPTNTNIVNYLQSQSNLNLTDIQKAEIESIINKGYQLRKCREDSPDGFIHFCEYVMRDTVHNMPWEIWDYQCEWIRDVYNNDKSMIFAPMEHGKSELFSLAYPLFQLGINPNHKIISVSDSAAQANKFVLAAKTQIKENESLQEVFPNLKPKEGDVQANRPARWRDGQLIVDRSIISKDYSWQAIGTFGSVLGSRATIILIDDLIDFENSRTKFRLDKITEWVRTELFSRLHAGTPTKVIIIGTPWAEGDTYHEMEKRTDFFSVRYSVEKDDVKDGFRHAGWPEREAELAEKKKNLPAHEYDRMYRCKTRGSDTQTFPDAKKCFQFLDDDLFTTHQNLLDYIQVTKKISKTDFGVDLSSAKRLGNALIGVAKYREISDTPELPNKLMKIVFHVEYGQWTSPETGKRISALDHQHGVDEWIVENNGYQEALREWMEALNLAPTITSFTTTSQKSDPEIGLPSLEAEFFNEEWVILLPNHTQEAIKETNALDCNCHHCRFAKELVYHPNGSSTDGVMALWFARGKKEKTSTYQPRASQLDKDGNFITPSVSLANFYPTNRITASRKIALPENVDVIANQFKALSLRDAEEILTELRDNTEIHNESAQIRNESAKKLLTNLQINDKNEDDKKNIIIVLQEMIYFTQVISSDKRQ